MSGPGSIVADGPGYSLRPLRDDDADALAAFAQDRRYWRFLAEGPRTADQVRDFVAGAIAASAQPDPREMWWAVVDPESRTLIGTANLKLIGDPVDGCGSVGCTLAPQAQGRGMGTALGWAMISLAFETFGLRRVECTCAEENEASVHIMKDVYGMTYEGLRHSCRPGSQERWSSHVYSMTDNAYAVLPPGYIPGSVKKSG